MLVRYESLLPISAKKPVGWDDPEAREEAKAKPARGGYKQPGVYIEQPVPKPAPPPEPPAPSPYDIYD